MLFIMCIKEVFISQNQTVIVDEAAGELSFCPSLSIYFFLPYFFLSFSFHLFLPPLLLSALLSGSVDPEAIAKINIVKRWQKMTRFDIWSETLNRLLHR